jgi:hypothetical protein
MPAITSTAASAARIAPDEDKNLARLFSHKAPDARAQMLAAEIVNVVRMIRTWRSLKVPASTMMIPRIALTATEQIKNHSAILFGPSLELILELPRFAECR